jgi:hypothetical protein
MEKKRNNLTYVGIVSGKEHIKIDFKKTNSKDVN